MLLAVDGVVNASSDNTVVVIAEAFNWYDFPKYIRESGPSVIPRGENPNVHILYPVPKVGASDGVVPPSTLAARKYFGDGDLNSYVTCPVNGDLWDVPAFRLAFSLAPQAWHFPSIPCASAIVILTFKPDGSFVLTLVQMLTYLAIGEAGEVALGAGKFLQVVGRMRLPGEPCGNALRLSSWLLPAGTDQREVLEVVQRARYGGGFEEYRFPASWPQPYNQTFLRADKSQLRAFDSRQEHLYPTSPLWHVNILAGDTLMIQDRGLYDFSGALLQFDAATREKSFAALYQLHVFTMMVLKAMLSASGLPELLAIPLDYAIDEIEGALEPIWDKLPIPHRDALTAAFAPT
jgi:hypothetical protein